MHARGYVIIGSLLFCGISTEPMCSKFHYEQQLLEKMIRMEFKMIDLEKFVNSTTEELQKEKVALKFEIKNTMQEESETVRNALERLQKDIELQKRELETVINSTTENLQSNAMELVTEIKNNMQAASGNVSSFLQVLNKEQEIRNREYTELRDGGWAEWNSWGSCNNDTMYRYRSCTNPSPSLLGKQCLGNSIDVTFCNRFGEMWPVFTADGISVTSGNARFTNVIFNSIGNYNSTTGFFTCNVPGIYLFSLNLYNYNTGNSAHCYICKNSSSLMLVYSYISHLYDSASAVVNIALRQGDVVSVCTCSGSLTLSSFSGVLIRPFY